MLCNVLFKLLKERGSYILCDSHLFHLSKYLINYLQLPNSVYIYCSVSGCIY